VIGAAAGLAVVLMVVAIVLASGGGGSGGTPTSPSPTLALSSSPTSSAPNTKFDEAFTSTKLRDYVRPYYDDIKSCDKTTTASFAAVQCQFTSGVSVIVFEVPAAITMTQLRTQVSSLLPGAEKITWRDGQLWTSAATGRSTLYWDVDGERLAGIAVQAGGTVPGLRAWWEGRFGS
jgi:hypothetical protein